MSIKTRYIGAEGAAWERLTMVFQAMGYREPTPEFEGAHGNYVHNVMGQYQADLSEDEVVEVIRFAERSRDDIRAALSGMSPDETEQHVLGRR